MMPTNLLKQIPRENRPRNLLRGEQPVVPERIDPVPMFNMGTEEDSTSIMPNLDLNGGNKSRNIPFSTPHTTDPANQEFIRRQRIPQTYLDKVKINQLLQAKYGDESTVTEREGRRVQLGGPRGVVLEYDENELLKRHLKATRGIDAPSSWNPLVHLGKEMVDLWTGTRQVAGAILPDWLVKPLSREEYEKWQFDDQIYQSGGQPLLAQLLGSATMAIPAVASTPAKAFIGSVLKRGSSKQSGEKMLRDAAFTGSTQAPKAFPGLWGAGEGAAYGGLQPLDPELGSYEQGIRRLSNATTGAMYGYGGELAMRGAGNFLQSHTTRRLKKDLQGSLPHPVEATTPLLYGNKVGQQRIVQRAKGINQEGNLITDSIKTREMAANQLYKMQQSLAKNFQAMNMNMSGSSNMRVGTSIGPVLYRFKQMANSSWKKVTAAYNKIDTYGKIIGDYPGYQAWLKNLEAGMEEKGIPLIKGSLNAYNQLKKVKPMRGGRVDELTGTPMDFDGGMLISRYKALNNIYKSAKPDARSAINHMRNELVDYMKKGYVTGDPRVLKQFREATDLASKHYGRYRGSKIIDKYLDGEATAPDVSTRIFSGKALDSSEMPKVQALDKILSVLPKSDRLLRNEVFSHLTTELGGIKQAADSIPKVRKHILSGSEGGVYNRIFTQQQMKQFDDLVRAADIENTTADIGHTSGQINLLEDFPSKSPLGLSRSLQDLTAVRRAEQGRISQSGDFAFGANSPVIMESQRKGAEDDAYQRMLNSLGIIDKRKSTGM